MGAVARKVIARQPAAIFARKCRDRSVEPNRQWERRACRSQDLVLLAEIHRAFFGGRSGRRKRPGGFPRVTPSLASDTPVAPTAGLARPIDRGISERRLQPADARLLSERRRP